MTDFAQGYALYAAVDFDGEGKPCLCAVVGWRALADESLAPLCVIIDAADNMDGRAMPAGTGADAVLYLGPDRQRAWAEVAKTDPQAALSAPQARQERPSVVRYAKGAVALCGLLYDHAPHEWTAPDHDYPIRCNGRAAS